MLPSNKVLLKLTYCNSVNLVLLFVILIMSQNTFIAKLLCFAVADVQALKCLLSSSHDKLCY